MNRLALTHPTSLLGRELREQLESRPDLWSELRLLSAREEEVGTVTELGGSATMVQRLSDGSLKDVDLIFLCDEWSRSAPILQELPDKTLAVILSLDAAADGAPPVVAGVNLDPELGPVVLSPHPGAVGLAHLIQPLRSHGLQEGVATLLQPVSVHPSEAALDEVFAQTRSLLSFQPTEKGGIFDCQLAFNLLPTPRQKDALVAQLRSVLEDDLALSVQVIQAGVFHGFAISLWCRFDGDPGEDAVLQSLAEQPQLELVEDRAKLGPIDAASRSEILVGHVRRDAGRPGTYWIWAVMDHLVQGAANAVQISATRLAARLQS